ncbi:DUF4199 domain-containing protein [Myroides sp. WP-1]|uniref:DUF4199 domain-containing protein n=1 Tax=Myroides sp. WP-1 TaxID=2759944 RepID=UPI0015F7D825|nr:DUF4199 domain-containing protein [Myroides sp. WP-1]MBB1140119.1 DUF4199 domain-containing protein [Myroides sp. WP-1]
MKKFSIEFKWAALATLAALVWMFIGKSMGFHTEKVRFEVLHEMLFSFLLFIFYWLGIRQKKREYYNNVIQWQQAFMTGLVLCVMITLFFPIIQFITFNQVSPHFMETLEQALINEAKMTPEEALQNASFDLFLRNGVMNNLSFGIIFTTIISYFLKTKNYDQVKAAAQKPEMVKVKKQKGKTKRK